MGETCKYQYTIKVFKESKLGLINPRIKDTFRTCVTVKLIDTY